MPKKVTQDEIVRMNDLYLVIGTYSGVARETGRSPSTVKRYIISDYTPQEETPAAFDENLWSAAKEFVPDYVNFMKEGFSLQTESEKEEMRTYWKELSL